MPLLCVKCCHWYVELRMALKPSALNLERAYGLLIWQ